MKRYIIITLVCILALCMFGCNKTEQIPEEIEYITEAFAETTAFPEAEIIEDRFILQSDGYNLNAVYTYVNDGQKHPTVLLIAGSGPEDCDETIGSLKPLADIAVGLVENGINSLRVDKRTENYAISFEITDGVEEEYLIDCRKAIAYMKSQDSCGDVWLLGHSQGGQIASVLATEDSSIKGMIIFNSSARSLAEIACDQYCRADSVNSELYKQYRDTAMAATADNAKGYYYFGGSDYYWSTLNQIDTIQNIKNTAIPILIINSKNDAQSFDVDINLWYDNFSNISNIEIYIDETMSHFGYDIDIDDNQSFIEEQIFPQRIIDLFVNFISE